MSDGGRDQESLSGDPLLDALPPKTDYITYLTILEYQLTAQNLPTLTRLLQEDDGTLASEIGWDLLKLVLPILRVEPDDAQQCLDTIARRGNPREVVVRVAEELESLGREEEEEGLEANSIDGDDGLPTFAGEAPRVHLGDITLQGMPPESQRTEPRAAPDPAHTHIEDEEPRLQALLSMLSLLQPRIRTKYPSRFLATSLPAALAAYRRLSMNATSTKIFLKTLQDLSGKKRPALPPRISTSNVTSSAPLPDPESKDAAGVTPAPEDAAISHRLLQAVLLEVVEEFVAASFEAQPPMTARLRTLLESDSLTTVRKAELDGLSPSTEAQIADDIRSNFVSIAKDLKTDVIKELQYLLEPGTPDLDEHEAEYDYPTKPSQIPFPATGLLILLAAQLYRNAFDDKTKSANTAIIPENEIALILRMIDKQYENDIRLRQSPPAVDSLLSILYLQFCQPVNGERQGTELSNESQTLLIATFYILQDIFVSLPDQDLRDNAYHIASHILHGHCQRETRMKILKTLLQRDVGSTSSPAFEAQSGNLKAIAVDWIKAESHATPNVLSMMSRLPEHERGLQLSQLNDMAEVIFPNDIHTVPGPEAAEETGEEALEAFSTDLPFYISATNLLWVIARNHDGPSTGSVSMSNVSASSSHSIEAILTRGSTMLDKLVAWKDYLSARLKHAVPNSTGPGAEYGTGLEVEGVSITDIFALEDAVSRATEVLGPHFEE